MNTYKVIVPFLTDTEDNNHLYREGDVFPRPGHSVSKSRLAKLSGTDNNIGTPLIAEIPFSGPTDNDETENSEEE